MIPVRLASTLLFVIAAAILVLAVIAMLAEQAALGDLPRIPGVMP